MEPKKKFPLSAIDDSRKEENLIAGELASYGLSQVAQKRRKLSCRQLKRVDGKIFNNNYKTACGFGSFEINADQRTEAYENSSEIKNENFSEVDEGQHFMDDEFNYEQRLKEDLSLNCAFRSRSPSPDNLSRCSSHNLLIDDFSHEKDNEESICDALTNYQDWVLKTYGDQTKTKTVTEKKYQRIIRTLKGEIPQCAENSKFRFWIRSKGFRIGTSSDETSEELYVSTIKVSHRTPLSNTYKTS